MLTIQAQVVWFGSNHRLNVASVFTSFRSLGFTFIISAPFTAYCVVWIQFIDDDHTVAYSCSLITHLLCGGELSHGSKTTSSYSCKSVFSQEILPKKKTVLSWWLCKPSWIIIKMCIRLKYKASTNLFYRFNNGLVTVNITLLNWQQ